MLTDIPNENDAFKELKENLVKCLWGFNEKSRDPKSLSIMKKALLECLNEINYQGGHKIEPLFCYSQIDHICYQIGEWYMMMKPLLEGRHNLGYMKEKLKTMICGE